MATPYEFRGFQGKVISSRGTSRDGFEEDLRGVCRGGWGAVCFYSLMRWKPEAERCVECGFSWSIAPADAVGLVDSSPQRVNSTLEGADRAKERPTAGVWSPSEYLWHLVDVLMIGRERLLTISTDPAAGIPCWDENALAEVRHYDALSPLVGLIAYESAAYEWVALARNVPVEDSVEHPQLGTLTAGDIMRRNAHEVQHHELDIRRGLIASAG
jgi:hypothetical protein